MSDITINAVGNKTEWQPFGERHSAFFDRLDHLIATLNAAFPRSVTLNSLESVLFFTGRQAVDDFFEILLLCGNGEGSGAEKLLRSFFERVVLIRYLHLHPDKVEDYYDYYYVSMKKVLDSAIRFRGPEVFDQAKVAETKANYERVKHKFKGHTCRECGHQTMGNAWSSVPLPDMAQDVGLGHFMFYAYTMPLLNAHPSLKGTLQRLEGEANGPIGFGDRVNRELADRVFATAHALLLNLIVVQVERCPVDGLKEMFDKANEHYDEIWMPPR